MFTKQKVGLLALALASVGMSGVAVAAQSDGLLSVSAELTSACAVSASPSISFTGFSTLATANQVANSASTFAVACSSDLTPTIFATGVRKIGISNAETLTFNLSLVSGESGTPIPAIEGSAATLTLTKDGTPKNVPLYATLLAADFNALPAGTYTSNGVTVSVKY